MCGIVMVVGKDRAANGRTASRAMGRMTHRGLRIQQADEDGASMAHVRLPIVGTGREFDQPMDAGRWLVGFVGEILDFRERWPGAECDSEIVKEAWVQGMEEPFKQFDGFWSVVAWDRERKVGYVLLDYLAQKPVYWRAGPGWTAVASEIDALACLDRVTPDRAYLAAVVKWGYCPENWRTPFQEVRKLAPGSLSRIEEHGVMATSIVDRLVPRYGGSEDLVREVAAATRRRVMSSDVPVGVLVSGGLDSSIVWSLARGIGRDPVAFHVDNGPDDEEACELVAPDAVKVTLDGIGLERALAYHQEPVDLGSLIPQACLSEEFGKRANQSCGGEGAMNVVLTGDGADELFGGYSRSLEYDSQASDVYHELVCWHLPRLDRVMMRNQVEVRSPFLARRVVEMALGLPHSLRKDKILLRRAFEGILPRSIAFGKKRALKYVDGGILSDCADPDADLKSPARRQRIVDLFLSRWASNMVRS